ncbi:hypothetical protein SLE2022_054730 [Rubroshorea leprosula]
MARPPPQPPQPIVSDVSKRLDNLERMVAENRNPLPPAQPSFTLIPTPLNTNIIQEPYPSGFKMPQFESYDGTKDLDDHLHAFYSVMQAQNASDALMCKIFPFYIAWKCSDLVLQFAAKLNQFVCQAGSILCNEVLKSTTDKKDDLRAYAGGPERR